MRKRSAGDLIAGKYRLEKPVACGGMGEVWAATNLQLDAPVALKLMSAHALASDDLVARFKREAMTAAQLRHTNVVTIHEHGVFEGVPFIVMELLEGQDLAARLKERKRLTHAEALPIVISVCKALHRAQREGIVHRDLKPANVFLARQDDEEIVKVLDFGIAKLLHGVLGAAATRSGTILGSVFYMAPEQARSEGVKIDHRADLWAVGVIAFRMLTGKLPFWSDPPISAIVRICNEPPPKASSIAPDLDARTDAFFARALGRRPEDRFQSARELATAFAALGDPPQSRPTWQSPEVDPPPDVQSANPGHVVPARPLVRSGRVLSEPAAQDPAEAGEHLGTVFVPPSTPQNTVHPAPPGEPPCTVFVQPPPTPPRRTPAEAPPVVLARPAATQDTPFPTPAAHSPLNAFPPTLTPPVVPPATPSAPPPRPVLPQAAAMTTEADLHPLAQARTTAIVTAAVVAALLAVAVVGWTVFSGTSSAEPTLHVR